MLKKIYAAILLVAVTAGTAALAQSGALKGRVIDAANSEGISFANVQLEQGGSAIAKTVADMDGNFTIKPITPGKYDIKAAAVGYQPLLMTGVLIGGDKTTYQDLKVKSTAIEITVVDIVAYEKPLIRPDNVQGKDVTRAEFDAMPSKNINSVASTAAGVGQADEGSALSMRGGRQNTNTSGDASGKSADGGGTQYLIDGVPTRGTYGLPQSDVEQVSVLTGGIPAQYGDATGGVISITTRGGVRPNFYGGVEVVSSQLTDKYGYNLANLSIGGPIMSKKDSSGHKDAKLGFFVSAQVSTTKDPNPSAVGHYKVNDDKLAQIQQHPLQLNADGTGLVPKADFITMNDMQHINAAQNTKNNSASFGGKIDFKASDKITLTLGGSMDYSNYNGFVYAYSLLSPSSNPQVISNNMRVYGKITHKLGRQRSKDEKSTALISNAFYTLLVSYNTYKNTQQNADHKDNFFDYGYVGKFQTNRKNVYTVVKGDTVGSIIKHNQTTWSDTSVQFTPGTQNPYASNYTSDYYQLIGTPKTITDIQNGGMGLLNGSNPISPNSLWNGTGRTYPAYISTQEAQLRVTGTFSADIKNNAIQAGFDYERRTDREFYVLPIGLWTLSRQLVNQHLTQRDTSASSGTLVNSVTSGGYTNEYYTHPYVDNSITNPSSQSQFDKNLRQELGLSNTQWIDIDNLNPSQLSLKLYTPDELLNNGSSYVSYYGNSIYGNKLTGTPFNMGALEKFYKGGVMQSDGTYDKSDVDANGNFKRTIPAFQPVYVSGYIQDKFDIKDMKFNIGLRVDAFNANQPMLRDKYLLNDAYRVSDGLKFNHPGYSIPSNMGSDYAVYVDDAKNPSKVVGYRNGDTWYNAQGVVVLDPTLIAQASSGGSIQPYLKYPHENFLDSSKVNNVFQMYSTQINLMPRIAFAFPISDQANFFAHYDVLTQRPPQFGRFDPTNYLFISTLYGAAIDNPALKPERTTDYEVGFTQVLTEKKNSSITISAFYRQMRDMLQMINVFDAYPSSYRTYDNVDFGNVKGFTVSYDLRRTQSSQLTASYTLQFAEGTGSAANSNAGAVNAQASGQPNLRTTNPLDFDQRHAIVLNYDYRFGSGKDYRGPQAAWAKAIFQNLGGNVIFRVGSGLPYSRLENVVSGNGNQPLSQQVIAGLNQPSQLGGSVNGSNMPWTYRMDLRIDKNIPLSWGKKGGEEKGKTSNLTVYLQVLNVLNTQNVLAVYRYTGDPKDDGYLSSGGGQQAINGAYSPQAYIDQYNAKLANPGFFSIPRQTRIGVVLNF